MAKISDRYYFDCFVKCADYACQAARLLKDVLAHFDTETLPDKLKEMHVIEHNADTCKHEMMTELIKAWICFCPDLEFNYLYILQDQA